MKTLILDGNPIGNLGAKAVMQVPLMIGARCSISVSKCNISIHQEAPPANEIEFRYVCMS